jgi:chorismate mutase
MELSPDSADEIDSLRTSIDEIDAQLIELINFRKEVSRQIQEHRIANGGARIDITRENKILQKYSEDLDGRRGVSLAMKILEMCRI